MIKHHFTQYKMVFYQETRKTRGSCVEHSTQFFGAQCSTQWSSAQYFRSKFQPNYQTDGPTSQPTCAASWLTLHNRALSLRGISLKTGMSDPFLQKAMA